MAGYDREEGRKIEEIYIALNIEYTFALFHQSTFSKMKRITKAADQFGHSQILGLSIGLLTVLAVLFVLTDFTLSGSRAVHILNKNKALVKTLGLTHLSLLPSGHMLRQPELANACVNLRYTPMIPFPSPDPAEMLISSPERQTK